MLAIAMRASEERGKRRTSYPAMGRPVRHATTAAPAMPRAVRRRRAPTELAGGVEGAGGGEGGRPAMSPGRARRPARHAAVTTPAVRPTWSSSPAASPAAGPSGRDRRRHSRAARPGPRDASWRNRGSTVRLASSCSTPSLVCVMSVCLVREFDSESRLLGNSTRSTTVTTVSRRTRRNRVMVFLRARRDSFVSFVIPSCPSCYSPLKSISSTSPGLHGAQHDLRTRQNPRTAAVGTCDASPMYANAGAFMYVFATRRTSSGVTRRSSSTNLSAVRQSPR